MRMACCAWRNSIDLKDGAGHGQASELVLTVVDTQVRKPFVDSLWYLLRRDYAVDTWDARFYGTFDDTMCGDDLEEWLPLEPGVPMPLQADSVLAVQHVQVDASGHAELTLKAPLPGREYTVAVLAATQTGLVGESEVSLVR